jgi:hypothetical protein
MKEIFGDIMIGLGIALMLTLIFIFIGDSDMFIYNNF